MDAEVRTLLNDILKEISSPTNYAAVESFASLRDVDAKVREVKMILTSIPAATQLVEEMNKDQDFAANSRRVRLETLANYCKTALKLFNTSVIQKNNVITSPPNLSILTKTIPELENVISHRWTEAQICKNSGAYLSSVIMMGSILEALLLARALMSPADAYKSSCAPKTREGKNIPIQDWNLNTLIDIAVGLGWIKTDRGKFGHALRESRNIVHPWAQISAKADFDLATCTTCWHVLNASVDDLLKTVS